MFLLLACASLLAIAPPSPDEPLPTLRLGDVMLRPIAQLRVRGESIPDRTLAGAPSRLVVSHRARAGATITFESIDVVMTFQDVRAWGSERVPEGLVPDPTINGKLLEGIQLYEAYAALHLGQAVEARVGRQSISLANERLVGRADFTMPGRAYDAVRLLGQGESSSWSVFASLVADASAPAGTENSYLGAASLEWKPTGWLRAMPALIADGSLGAAADDIGQQRATFGARIDGGTAGFGYDLEGWGQTTSPRNARSTFGMMAGARATYEVDAPLHPKVGLGADALSGNADGVGSDGKLAPFDTINGTNHGFYGIADMFTAIPLHTRGRGLIDGAATLWIHEGPWSSFVSFHASAPFATNVFDEGLYGVEPDIFGSWKPLEHFAVEGGCALFVPTGPALGRGDHAASWAYLQLQAWL